MATTSDEKMAASVIAPGPLPLAQILQRTPAEVLLDEYREHKRCPNCKRPTAGIDEYKNRRSGTLTRQCIRCRDITRKSIQKHPRKLVTTPLGLHEQLELMTGLIKDMDVSMVGRAIAANAKYARLPEVLGGEYRASES